jgi:periplasmic protein TonB
LAKELIPITTDPAFPVFSKELFVALFFSLAVHGVIFFAITLLPGDNRTPAPILKHEIRIDLTSPAISEPEPETPLQPPVPVENPVRTEKPETDPEPKPAEPAVKPRKETATEPAQQAEESNPSEESPPVERAGPERPGPEAVPSVPSPAERRERARDRTLKDLYNRLSETLHYPPAARRRGTEGIVGVRLHIGTDGRLLEAIVVSTSGSRVLDNAALSGIKELFPYPHPIDTNEPFFLTMHITFALN